jgi:hypothetical protein
MKSALWLSVILILCSCQGASVLVWDESSRKATTIEGLNAPALLQSRCASCHNSAKNDGNFKTIGDVDAMINEGRIVPGNADDSRLFVVMSTNFMPPDNPMTEEELSLIRRWIAEMDPYADDPNYHYSQVVSQVIEPVCLRCHTSGSKTPLTTYDEVRRYVVSGRYDLSLFYEMMTRQADGHVSDGVQRKIVREWILRGARP